MKLLFCYDGPISIDKDGNAYPQTFTEEVLSRYYALANEITMFTRTRIIDPKETKIPKANMERLRIASCPNLATVKGKVLGKYKVSEKLHKEIQKCDYLIIRLPSNIGNIALDLANKIGKPYLVEVVACRWDTLWYHSLKGQLLAPFSFTNTKKSIKRSEAVVYITEEFLQKRYPTNGKRFVCPNVSLKEVDSAVLENRKSFIDKMQERKKISIASIGATNMRYKGHVYMIKAVDLLIKKGYDVEYHIIGGGDSSWLEKSADDLGIKNKILFHGVLPHNEIFNFLDNIDVYVQPSLAEAQGRSLLEAMSRGLPCVCTNVGGMPELIQEQFIAIKKDPESIADKVIKIINSDMKEIAKRNFEFAKNFNNEAIMKKRKDIYMSVFKTDV
ncbi:glycosyltransferase [Bacillus alkalisoli]|uniref:glycosyltransferase n=1 Tax=Bacillus alkalisoli TaxID=2011008 RepID=UPI000C23D574|nr:glycosyltransferase [Bacillus alkalisoli]